MARILGAKLGAHLKGNGQQNTVSLANQSEDREVEGKDLNGFAAQGVAGAGREGPSQMTKSLPRSTEALRKSSLSSAEPVNTSDDVSFDRDSSQSLRRNRYKLAALEFQYEILTNLQHQSVPKQHAKDAAAGETLKYLKDQFKTTGEHKEGMAMMRQAHGPDSDSHSHQDVPIGMSPPPAVSQAEPTMDPLSPSTTSIISRFLSRWARSVLY